MAKTTTYTASNLDKYTIAQLEVAVNQYDDMIKKADENGDLAKKQIFAARQARIIKQQYAIKRMHAKLSQKFPSIKNANVRTISILTMKRTEGKEIVQGEKNKTGYGFGGLMNDLKGVGLGVSTGLIAYGTANSILVATTGQGVFDNIGSLITKLADIGGVGFNIAGASTILAGAGAIAAIGVSCLVAKKIRQIQANRIAAMRASLEEDEALAKAEEDIKLKEAHPEQEYNDTLISNDSLRQNKVQEIASDPKKLKELKDLLNMKDLSPEQKSAIYTIVSLAQVEAANMAKSRASKQIFAGLQATPESEAFKEAQKKKRDLTNDKADFAAENAKINAMLASGSDYDKAKNNYTNAFNSYTSGMTSKTLDEKKQHVDNKIADLDTVRKKYANTSGDPAKNASVDRIIAIVDQAYNAAIAAGGTPPTDGVLKTAAGTDPDYKADVAKDVNDYINAITTGSSKNIRELAAKKEIYETQQRILDAAISDRDKIISKYHPDYATLKANAATASTSSDHAAAKADMEAAITALDTAPTKTLDGGQTVYDSKIRSVDNALNGVASNVSKEVFDKIIASMDTLSIDPAHTTDDSKTIDVLQHWSNKLGIHYTILQNDSNILALAVEFAKNNDIIPAFNATRKFEALDAPVAALADVESGQFFDAEIESATQESDNAYTDTITAACNSVDKSIKDHAKAQAMKNKIQAMSPAQLEAFLQKDLDKGAAELGA